MQNISVTDLAPFFFGKRKGAFCVLGFYMDDSADTGREKVFSVAGFVGESSDWFDVERHWSRVLEREGIDYFRTYDCVNLEGEFRRKLVDKHGLTVARVIADAMLAELKQIIATSNIFGYSLAVLMDDYRQVLSEPDGPLVLDPDPYLGSHYQLIGFVLKDLQVFPGVEVCAFLYDEHSKAHLLQQGWQYFKQANPNYAKHAGTLAPLDDKQHIPIQVADLLAHTTTRLYDRRPVDLVAAYDKLRTWLGVNLTFAAYCNAKYLRELVAANAPRIKAQRQTASGV
jgi:hypothetical protein